MTTPIPLNLAVEDPLTESLFSKILAYIPANYAVRTIYNAGGYGYLKTRVNGFNRAARGIPFLVGTDLDQYECPVALIHEWIHPPKHHNLLLRIAVREAEAWVLADKDNFANFLGIRASLVPDDVESLVDAKHELIQLARKARSREVREDICPPIGSTRRVGPNYNARLVSFVQQRWIPTVARNHAHSLARAMECLSTFNPLWPDTP